jgi:hypothetical protein
MNLRFFTYSSALSSSILIAIAIGQNAGTLGSDKPAGLIVDSFGMAGPCGFASVVLALTLFGIQFGIIALIGMTLPIGVATKNAILMTNSAPRAQRDDGTEPREAIFHVVVV